MKKTLLFAMLNIGGLFLSQQSFANAPFSIDLEYRTKYSSNVIIKSRSDNLIIRDMNINRGNCSMDVKGVYGGASGKTLQEALYKLADRDEIKKRAKRLGFPESFNIEADYQMAQQQAKSPRLGFGKQFKIEVNCKTQDILEINVDTDQGNWTFGQ